MERTSLDDDGESILASPMLIFRELVDPHQWCCAWKREWGGNEIRARHAWCLAFKLWMASVGRARRSCRGRFCDLGSPWAGSFTRMSSWAVKLQAGMHGLGSEHDTTIKYNAHSTGFCIQFCSPRSSVFSQRENTAAGLTGQMYNPGALLFLDVQNHWRCLEPLISKKPRSNAQCQVSVSEL